MNNKCKNPVLQNFPYLEDDFDALTDYKLFSKMVGYVRSLEKYFKDKLDDDLLQYIHEEFDRIMMDATYDSTNEKIIFYLEDGDE